MATILGTLLEMANRSVSMAIRHRERTLAVAAALAGKVGTLLKQIRVSVELGTAIQYGGSAP